MKARPIKAAITSFALLTLASCLLANSAQTQSGAEAPGPELKQLEVFVGEWTYRGEQVDPPISGPPFGPAGRFEGKETTRFVLDGFFQESTVVDKNPSGLTKMIVMVGYDTKAKKYTENVYFSDGTRSESTATLDGRTWTSVETMTTGSGEEVLLKTVRRYSPDWARYTSTTDASKDGGKTWKHWFSMRGIKLKK